jgi:putative flippase GtrA
MSAAPIDPELAKIAQEAMANDNGKMLDDVAKFAPLGAAAMLARCLMSTEPVSVGWIARRMIAAAVTSVIAGFATQDYIHSEGLRYAAVGCLGYASPEVMDYVLRYIKAKGEQQISKVKSKKK